MELGDRLGIAGLILGLIGLGVTILWPTKRPIGIASLVIAGVLGVWWGMVEVHERPSSMTRTAENTPDKESTTEDATTPPLTAKPSPKSTGPANPPAQHQSKQQTVTEVHHAMPPVGQLAFGLGNDSTLTMRDSQLSGYTHAVQTSTHDAVDVEHSQIQASSDPLGPMPSPTSSAPATTGSGSTLSNITILGDQSDLPLTPIPAGTSTSNVPADEQRRIVNALADRWRSDHPRWPTIRKKAILWMNQQLEAQNKDFRVQVPEICPTMPGLVGVALPRGTAGRLDGVGMKGVAMGATVNGAQLDVNNSEIAANNCD